jgi:hypothetical protein
MSALTGPDFMDANRAVQQLTKTKTELGAMLRQLDEQLRTARTFRDPDLTPDAQARRREELVSTARQHAGAYLTRTEAQVDQAAAMIRRVADRALNKEAGDPSAQLLTETRQARAWERALSLLEAGRPIGEVIDGADLDTLYGLRAELPTYLATQTSRPPGLDAAGHTEIPPDMLLHTIDRALTGKLPAKQAAALRARLDLDELEPGLRELLAGIRREVEGTAENSNGMYTAIAVRLADQQPRALPAPSTSPAEPTA